MREWYKAGRSNNNRLVYFRLPCLGFQKAWTGVYGGYGTQEPVGIETPHSVGRTQYGGFVRKTLANAISWSQGDRPAFSSRS